VNIFETVKNIFIDDHVIFKGTDFKTI